MFSKNSGPGLPTDLPDGWGAERRFGQSLYEAHKEEIAQREWQESREQASASAVRDDTLEATRAKPSDTSSAGRVKAHGRSTPGWDKPRTGPQKLPLGWSATKTNDGETFYVNHIERTTTWELPVATSSHTADKSSADGVGGRPSDKPRRNDGSPTVTARTSSGTTNSSNNTGNNSSSRGSSSSHRRSTSTHARKEDGASSSNRRGVGARAAADLEGSNPQLLTDDGFVSGNIKPTSYFPEGGNEMSTSTASNSSSSGNNRSSSSGNNSSSNSSSNSNKKAASTSIETNEAAPFSGRRRVENKPSVGAEKSMLNHPDGKGDTVSRSHVDSIADGVGTTHSNNSGRKSDRASGGQMELTSSIVREKNPAPKSRRPRVEDRSFFGAEEQIISQLPDGGLFPGKPKRASRFSADSNTTSTGTTNSGINGSSSHRKTTSTSVRRKEAGPFKDRHREEDRLSTGIGEPTLQLASGGLIPEKSRRTSPSPAAVTTTTSSTGTSTTKTNGNENRSHRRSTSTSVKTRGAGLTSGHRRVEDQSSAGATESTLDGELVCRRPRRTSRPPLRVTATTSKGTTKTSNDNIISSSQRKSTLTYAQTNDVAPPSRRRRMVDQSAVGAKETVAQLPDGGLFSEKPRPTSRYPAPVTATAGAGKSKASTEDSRSGSGTRKSSTSASVQRKEGALSPSLQKETEKPLAGTGEPTLELPDGWSVALSKSKRRYYVNNIDGTTTWEKPRGPATSGVRARAGPSGSTHVQKSPSATASGRDEIFDRRRASNADNKALGKSTIGPSLPLKVKHRQDDAGLARHRTSLVVKDASRGDGSPALPARRVSNPTTGHYRERSASGSSNARAASNTCGSKSPGDHTGQSQTGSASITLDFRRSPNTTGSKARDDRTGHSRRRSASTPPGNHTYLNNNSKSRNYGTRTSRGGSALTPINARTASNNRGSKTPDDRAGHSPGWAALNSSETSTGLISNRMSRDDRTKHSGGSASSSSNARATSKPSGGKSRVDRDISAEKGSSGRAAVPPPKSRPRNDSENVSSGGRVAPSAQIARSPKGQTRRNKTRPSDASAKASPQLEAATVDPAKFDNPKNTQIPVEIQQELTRNLPQGMQHIIANQGHGHSTATPPGAFTQSLHAGVNLQPSKLATGLGKGVGKFAKKIVAVPNVKLPSTGYAGLTGGGFSIPGGFSAEDLKANLNVPSSSAVKRQMGGRATKMLNGMIKSGLDAAGVGESCEVKLKKKNGKMKWAVNADFSGSDSEAEQDCSHDADIQVEVDIDVDVDDVLEWEPDAVEPDEEKEEEEEEEG